MVKRVINKFTEKLKSKPTCCHGEYEKLSHGLPKVIIVGNPNVGKSVIFNALTGKYVTVSNYPGTTVEVSRGKGKFKGKECEVIDTPGIYSFLPITEEERVARRILLEEHPEVVIQVIDAKNLERMLPFTFQLIEAGFPLILVLNLMDEAEKLGLYIDINELQKKLDIPVIGTTAVEGKNIDKLKELIGEKLQNKKISKKNKLVYYGKDIEEILDKVESLLTSEYNLSKRIVALLLCLGDNEISSIVKEKEKYKWNDIEKLLNEIKIKYSLSLNYIIAIERQKLSTAISETVIKKQKERKKQTIQEKLSKLTMNPITGFFIFFIIIFLLYEFVGVFGAQIAVDFLEEKIFGEYINPYVNKFIASIIPWKILQDLFAHEYGIITLGLRYAVAIILPIVATFFIAFSIIEDSGYLPRLAMLIDRGFKKLGLNGRAIIPIVLGFGCNTMATMTTRTLETKRERVIASFLLALAIPCSAQLGVILGLLSGNVKALFIWGSTMSLVFILIGYLAAKIMPGEKAIFYMEVPPLRWPKLSNVVVKTYTRVEWYFKEVLPLFIYASIFIWIGRITGIFDLVINMLQYPAKWIGLPKESAIAFLFGFFRRDYGAAGLYDLKQAGILTGIPLIVSVVTLTLFVPCIAQFSMNIKERGFKTALLMAGFIFPFAFIVGGILNFMLNLLGVTL